MPITRSVDQTSKTLEEFYGELLGSTNEYNQWVGRDMLAFIEVVNQTFAETQLYGQTSLAHLVIYAESNCEAHAYVRVRSSGGEYYFEYPLPREKAPWPYAVVQGVASTLEKAKSYLLIAMRESEGWKGNAELEALLAAEL